MSKNDHFTFLGRTSEEIAFQVLNEFGDAEISNSGKLLISKAGKIIQARAGKFEDDEANAELFVDGKLPDHPVEQMLSQDDKDKIARKLKNSHVTIVLAASGVNTSSRAWSLIFLAEMLKEVYRVAHITAICPALPFMRSDRRFQTVHPDGSITKQYNAVAGKYFARHLKLAGVDKVVGFEPHSRDAVRHYRKAFGKKNVSFVNMGAFFAETIGKQFTLVKGEDPLVMVGAPDGMNKPNDYGIARASSFGAALYKGTALEKYADVDDFTKRPYMFGIHKNRINSKKTEIVGFHGEVAGKTCIIIDDIISGGSTTLEAAKALKERGAKEVIAVATHGVLVNGALQKLLDSPYLDKIMLTDTIPGVLDKLKENGLLDHPKLVVETIAPLVNKEIEKDFGKKGGAKPKPQVC